MYIFYKFSLRSLVAQGRFDSGWRLRPFCHVRNVSFSGVPQAVTRFFATSLDKWEPFIQLPLSKKFIVFDKVHSFRRKSSLFSTIQKPTQNVENCNFVQFRSFSGCKKSSICAPAYKISFSPCWIELIR